MPSRLWDVVDVLTRRALKTRYRGSILGVYWSLLNPILMTTVYAAIFGANFAMYYGSLKHYVVALFLGLVVVNFFIASTQGALTSLVAHATLLNKVRIPSESFPISAIAAQAFQLCVGVGPILIVLLLFFSRAPWHIVLLPLLLAALVLVSAGVGFVASALYVYFRDVPYLYDFVAFLVWITTPVFYPVAIVPPHLRAILYWNPLYPILASLRDIVTEPALKEPTMLAIGLGEGALICAVGYLVFRLMRNAFMDLL